MTDEYSIAYCHECKRSLTAIDYYGERFTGSAGSLTGKIPGADLAQLPRLVEITANRKLIFERKAMSVTDIGIITDEIWVAIQRFDHLRNRIGSDLAASLQQGPGRE